MNIHATWKPIHGFEDRYMINLNGDVKTIHRKSIDSIGRNHTHTKQIMTQFLGRGGYWTVKLTKDRKYGTQYIHRLLALTFIENPQNKPFVNHINGLKLDNSIGNLEWVTRSENQIHAIKNHLSRSPHENSRPVLDRCTGITYPSIKTAARARSIPYYDCIQMLHRRAETCLEFAA